VEDARSRAKEARAIARSYGDIGSAYDEVWCVFDVDDHERLAQAIDQAKANRIHVAISNPCFELWALMHYQDQRAYITRDHVRAELRRYIPGYEKSLPCVYLIDTYDEARTRARFVQDMHLRTGDDPRSNPSSNVWQVIESLRHG
jgi:hypothetical protein